MPTRVLLCDDSPSVCRLLAAHIRTSSDLEVVGTVGSGEQAVVLNEQLRPDVVTLDLEMPGMGGLTALEQMMERRPVPVVLLSGVSRSAAELTVRALAAGAIDFIPKYFPARHTDPDALKEQLLRRVRLAAGVKVIRSLPARGATGRVPRYVFEKPTADLICTPSPALGPYPTGGVVVIGASTGGPTAVRELLNELSTDFPAAVIVVQHLPPVFTAAFAEQLDRHTPLPAKEAASGDRLRPGMVLVAPGDRHVAIRPDGRVSVTEEPKVGGHRPSVDVTMSDAAAVYGHRATGVQLTGMGADGAVGMKAIRDAGGRTFAQSEDSCVVYGMPERAVEAGAVEVEDTPAGIGTRLLEFARSTHPRAKTW